MAAPQEGVAEVGRISVNQLIGVGNLKIRERSVVWEYDVIQSLACAICQKIYSITIRRAGDFLPVDELAALEKIIAGDGEVGLCKLVWAMRSEGELENHDVGQAGVGDANVRTSRESN